MSDDQDRDRHGERAEENAAPDERAEIDRLIYAVSHDMRSPLQLVSGFAELLEDQHGASFDEDATYCLSRIRLGAARLHAMLEELTWLSRAGNLELDPAEVDLVPLVRGAVLSREMDDSTRKTQLTLPESLRIEGDPTLLAALVERLVDNAWKFSASREETVIELGKEDGEIYLRDNGQGIDPELTGRMFTPFERLHSPPPHPGFGIGLATAQRIVARHKGSIRATSSPNEGTTIYLTLP